RVIDRLPEIVDRPRGEPVAVESPYLYQLAALPGQLVLVPCLGAVRAGGVGSGLRLHIHIVAVNHRHLEMGQQVSAVGSFLLSNKWVKSKRGEYRIQALPCYAHLASVLRIEGPLRPEWRAGLYLDDRSALAGIPGRGAENRVVREWGRLPGKCGGRRCCYTGGLELESSARPIPLRLSARHLRRCLSRCEKCSQR